MPQFMVYRNKNPATKSRVPFLMDVQRNLLSELDSRVVIPLYARATVKAKVLTVVTPVIEIDGKDFVLMTAQLAGISKKGAGSVGDSSG